MQRISVQQFHDAQKLPLVVVLDQVRSLYNVGSIFRTSDAFRVSQVILCGVTATPPHPEIHKTALGAEESVNWCYYNNTIHAVAALKAQGYTLLAVEQCKDSTNLQHFIPDPHTKYAIILGNEVKGVQQQVIDACHHCLEIPQFGTKHSINVSVAAAIVIWHFAHNLYL